MKVSLLDDVTCKFKLMILDLIRKSKVTKSLDILSEYMRNALVTGQCENISSIEETKF